MLTIFHIFYFLPIIHMSYCIQRGLHFKHVLKLFFQLNMQPLILQKFYVRTLFDLNLELYISLIKKSYSVLLNVYVRLVLTKNKTYFQTEILKRHLLLCDVYFNHFDKVSLCSSLHVHVPWNANRKYILRTAIPFSQSLYCFLN